MEVKTHHEEETKKMFEMNIANFIEAARQHLFGALLAEQLVLTSPPADAAR